MEYEIGEPNQLEQDVQTVEEYLTELERKMKDLEPKLKLFNDEPIRYNRLKIDLDTLKEETSLLHLKTNKLNTMILGKYLRMEEFRIIQGMFGHFLNNKIKRIATIC